MTFPSHFQYLNDSLSKSLWSLKVYFRAVAQRILICVHIIICIQTDNNPTQLLSHWYMRLKTVSSAPTPPFDISQCCVHEDPSWPNRTLWDVKAMEIELLPHYVKGTFSVFPVNGRLVN